MSYALAATAAVPLTPTTIKTTPLALAGIVLLVAYWILAAKCVAQEPWFCELYNAHARVVGYLISSGCRTRRSENAAK